VAERDRRGGVSTAEGSSRGQGSLALTLQVGELMGQVRGGLSEKSEGGCVRAGVLTGDRGDGGGNDGISGRVAGAACGRGRGELGGAGLRWPLGAAGGFAEEKWRERGVDPGSAMEKRGGERKGGSGAGSATRGQGENGARHCLRPTWACSRRGRAGVVQRARGRAQRGGPVRVGRGWVVAMGRPKHTVPILI
jgi:hypothetical protein